MESNMAALVVGGDNIESLRQELLAQGIQTVTHWSGRKHVEKYNLIPRNIELVVVLVNYVNHILCSKMKTGSTCADKYRRCQEIEVKVNLQHEKITAA